MNKLLKFSIRCEIIGEKVMKNMFNPWMMITNLGIMTGVWCTLIWIVLHS